jgi:exopolyphosphatase/guanosine-5'-triphosphate,3'-diphosphate pyrophosphatase
MHADLPGFSRREQQAVAMLVLGQRGKLSKIQSQLGSPAQRAAVMCFRLACLLYRRRLDLELPEIDLTGGPTRFRLEISGSWLEAHPLTVFGLQNEAAEWSKCGIDLQLQPVQEGGVSARRSAAGA